MFIVFITIIPFEGSTRGNLYFAILAKCVITCNTASIKEWKSANCFLHIIGPNIPHFYVAFCKPPNHSTITLFPSWGVNSWIRIFGWRSSNYLYLSLRCFQRVGELCNYIFFFFFPKKNQLNIFDSTIPLLGICSKTIT